MNNYSWIAATIGIVLALGMTRLLSNGVAVFRSRRRATLHWVPIVWAFCIFYSMLDLSWDLHNLSDVMAQWTLARALMLFAFAVVLFSSAALVLPSQELADGGSLREEFALDGRWALIFLAAYDLLCILFNWTLWHVSPFSFFGALNLMLATLALSALRTSIPKFEEVATVLYAILIFVFAYLSG